MSHRRYSQPPPPNTADLGTDEKAAVYGNRRYWESYITYKTLIWDLEMGGGIGGGDGIGRGGMGGDCIPMCHIEKYSHLLPFSDCQLAVYCSYSHCRVVRTFVV